MAGPSGLQDNSSSQLSFDDAAARIAKNTEQKWKASKVKSLMIRNFCFFLSKLEIGNIKIFNYFHFCRTQRMRVQSTLIDQRVNAIIHHFSPFDFSKLSII